METCVLIPQEFSLVVSGQDRLGEAGFNNNNEYVKEAREVSVWSNTRIPQGTLVYPFQGTVRLDNIHEYGQLHDSDIRHRFGCYDEVTESSRRLVRHCNWVRFLRAVHTYSPEVNLIGTMVKGEPIYEAVKTIPAHTELVAFFLPETSDDLFLMPAVNFLRNTLYRKTMDAILEESPLDLSMSLLSRAVPQPSASPTSVGEACDEHKSISGESLSSALSTTSSAEDLLLLPDTLATDAASLLLPPGARPARMAAGGGNIGGSPATAAAAMAAAAAAAAAVGAHSVSVTSSPGVTPVGASRSRPARIGRGERTLLPCEVCGKSFDRPSLLKRHMRTHTGEKPHVCSVCSKGFSTSSSLNTHRRIHSGEKPHQCPVCGKRFTASSNLYYHRMTHVKEKPHKCGLCSKSFPTPGDLKSHQFVHSGSWPFKCHICSRGFSKLTNLKNHLFLHTGDKPHACALCHKKFALACNLRAHMKTHEGEPHEECNQCGKVLPSAAFSSPGAGNGNRNTCNNCAKTSSPSSGNHGSSPPGFGDSGSEESCSTSIEYRD